MIFVFLPNIIYIFICKIYLPDKELEMTMFVLSSLRHVIVGFGYPVAAHCNVTLLPSWTTMSELVG